MSQSEIQFEFSSVRKILKKRIKRFIEDHIPRIVDADVARVSEEILKDEGRFCPAGRADKFRDHVSRYSKDGLVRRFKELVKRQTKGAYRTAISFQRTLRLPDDGETYPLPPGLGEFPLVPVKTLGKQAPKAWRKDGGVVMPMYQAEALWMFFRGRYPIALKVATGSVNAVNGRKWKPGLRRDPQGYVVLPEQPWLDGFCVEKGVVRQFVATQVGDGYTAEEQLRGTKEGGMRFEAIPLKPDVYFEKRLVGKLPRSLTDILNSDLGELASEGVRYCMSSPRMGLGGGGLMKQDIYEDPWHANDWDSSGALSRRVHICNAVQWCEFTGKLPPHEPFTTEEYTCWGLPWFDFYRSDLDAIDATGKLTGLRSVQDLAKDAGDVSVPEDKSSVPAQVIPLVGGLP